MKYRYADMPFAQIIRDESGTPVFKDKVLKIGACKILYTFDRGNDSDIPSSVNLTFGAQSNESIMMPPTTEVLSFFENVEERKVAEFFDFVEKNAI